MPGRMSPIDRMLSMVHMLADSNDGLTLDEMARDLEVGRRTIERMRNIIELHFDLAEVADTLPKRYRIEDSLRRVYTRPTAAEVAILQIEVMARKSEKSARAALLDALLIKVKCALDDREMRKLNPKLKILQSLQREQLPPGPIRPAANEQLQWVQHAMLDELCLDFEYTSAKADRPRPCRVVPLGLIHGPTTYLLAADPEEPGGPTRFRLDRMANCRLTNCIGKRPANWDLDTWMATNAQNFDDGLHDIVLRVRAAAVAGAKGWRFHPEQVMEEDGNELLIRFRSNGLRMIADHVFTWGGDVVIEGPQALRDQLRARLDAAERALDQPCVASGSAGDR